MLDKSSGPAALAATAAAAAAAAAVVDVGVGCRRRGDPKRIFRIADRDVFSDRDFELTNQQYMYSRFMQNT